MMPGNVTFFYVLGIFIFFVPGYIVFKSIYTKNEISKRCTIENIIELVFYSLFINIIIIFIVIISSSCPFCKNLFFQHYLSFQTIFNKTFITTCINPLNYYGYILLISDFLIYFCFLILFSKLYALIHNYFGENTNEKIFFRKLFYIFKNHNIDKKFIISFLQDFNNLNLKKEKYIKLYTFSKKIFAHHQPLYDSAWDNLFADPDYMPSRLKITLKNNTIIEGNYDYANIESDIKDLIITDAKIINTDYPENFKQIYLNSDEILYIGVLNNE